MIYSRYESMLDCFVFETEDRTWIFHDLTTVGDELQACLIRTRLKSREPFMQVNEDTVELRRLLDRCVGFSELASAVGYNSFIALRDALAGRVSQRVMFALLDPPGMLRPQRRDINGWMGF